MDGIWGPERPASQLKRDRRRGLDSAIPIPFLRDDNKVIALWRYGYKTLTAHGRQRQSVRQDSVDLTSSELLTPAELSKFNQNAQAHWYASGPLNELKGRVGRSSGG